MKFEDKKLKMSEMSWTASIHFLSESKPFTNLLMTLPRNLLIIDDKKKSKKLYKVNETSKEESKKGESQWMSIINSLKENDLLLLSSTKLSEINSLFNTENKSWKEIQDTFDPDKGIILCVVDKKLKKTESRIPLKASCDNSYKIHSKCKSMANSKQDFYCYMVTSLSTMVREYKAIKCVEFSNFFKSIMNPSIISKQIHENEEKLKIRDLYKEFLQNNKKHFNISQLNALKYVAKLSESGLSLIQGPPGTGKTHTILGIISMAYTCYQGDSSEKILVCTPSNAACDEIVYRLAKLKLLGVKGKEVAPKMVRIGAFDYEPNKIVKNYTLDHLIEIEQGTCDENNARMDEIEKQVYLLEKSNQEITSNTHSDIILKSNNENILKELRQEKSKLVIDTNALRHVKSSTARSSATIECEILHNVKIILTTLSLSGIELLDKMEFTYSHLIVDEACQSTEISTLIPFTHKIKNVVLVGDQNQLPSTVFSSDAEKTLFNRSLYERFLDNKIETFLLTIQYRMCKEIREFPSNQFYRGELTDDESILTRNVNDHDGWIPRLMFYDLSYTSEDKTSNNEKSKSNKLEAEFVSKLFIEAIYQKGDGDFYKGLAYVKRDVGIITPYKRQSKVIRELIEKSIQSEMKKKSTLYNEEIKNFDVNKYLEVNTVDSYQGREKDTIIISLVRSSKDSKVAIGFLNDFRRMNVAITRAKNFLWIVGNSQTLNKNK